jgi:hypothetical protein
MTPRIYAVNLEDPLPKIEAIVLTCMEDGSCAVMSPLTTKPSHSMPFSGGHPPYQRRCRRCMAAAEH